MPRKRKAAGTSPPPQELPPAEPELWLSQLAGSPLVQSGHLVSLAPDAPQLIVAEQGPPMRAEEAAAVVEGVRKATLHEDYVSVAGHHYLITSIQRTSYYGRDVQTAVESGGEGGGGLLVIRTVTMLVVVTYAFPTLAAEVVPLAELFADKLIEHSL